MGKVYDKVLEFQRKFPGGIAWRINKHCKVVESYLNPDEDVIYAFCAQKNNSFKDIFHTYAVVITTKRILLGHKRLIWGSFYHSVTPDMYNDMKVYRGLFFGKIIIDTIKELIVLSNISKKGLDDIETTISEFMMELKKKYQERECQERICK